MEDLDVKKIVRDRYGMIADQGSCGCSSASPCCGGGDMAQLISKGVGYSDDELESVPEGANLGLGCGNPVAIASLKEGETVLDLGSGAGFDCFLAADRVGKTGKVIGVDMTPEMVARARENIQKGDYANVEFRLGEIENLPVADASVDVIISNCVINLSPNKRRVFAEAYRVLKPSGRLLVSDIVLLKELPPTVLTSAEAYAICIAGAALKTDYIESIGAAGFQDVMVIDETPFPIEFITNDPTAVAIITELKISSDTIREVASSIVSTKVSAVKPE
ncbi:arsenite methyltransferase [Chloroflexota bacterium]